MKVAISFQLKNVLGGVESFGKVTGSAILCKDTNGMIF